MIERGQGCLKGTPQCPKAAERPRRAAVLHQGPPEADPGDREAKRVSEEEEGGPAKRASEAGKAGTHVSYVWSMRREGPDGDKGAVQQAWRNWRALVWRLLGGDIEEQPGPGIEELGDDAGEGGEPAKQVASLHRLWICQAVG